MPKFGYKLTPEHKDKIRKAHLGKKQPPRSKEWSNRISIAKTGKKRPPFSEEWKRKIGLYHKGENNVNWIGGKSFEKYPKEWTKTLKRSIRERDNYVCQVCSALQGDIAFSVHHIDYNKQNCNPTNLITLCRSCHRYTNDDREEWEKYFNNKIL